MSPRAALLALAWALGACDKERPPELPPAEVYDTPIVVTGHWRGEVAGIAGELAIDQLAPQRFRGMFVASDQPRRYVLNMTQRLAPDEGGVQVPANLIEFRWQDGRGDRGAGWLLVNRDGSALTGSFGRGEGVAAGAGEWTMVRDGPPPGPQDVGDTDDTLEGGVLEDDASDTDGA